MVNIKKTYHYVAIYLFNNTLYVIPFAECPPLFIWMAVNPVVTVTDYNVNNLATAINSAKEASKSRFDPASADSNIKPFHARKNPVWNRATKSWSLLWKEDGNVDMRYETPDKMYRGTMQWKIISKKTFSPPISSPDIAQEILNQI